MMIKCPWLCILLGIALEINAQDLRLESGIGFAIARDTPGYPKQIFLCTETKIGTEFFLKEKLLSVNVSAALFRLRCNNYDTAGQRLFTRKHFISLPVTIRKYYTINNKSSFFLEGGIYMNWLMSDKRESVINDNLVVQTSRRGQLSGGGCGAIGFKTKVNANIFYSAAFFTSTDLWTKDNNAHKSKMDRTLLQNSFYIKLKR